MSSYLVVCMDQERREFPERLPAGQQRDWVVEYQAHIKMNQVIDELAARQRIAQQNAAAHVAQGHVGCCQIQ